MKVKDWVATTNNPPQYEIINRSQLLRLSDGHIFYMNWLYPSEYGLHVQIIETYPDMIHLKCWLMNGEKVAHEGVIEINDIKMTGVTYSTSEECGF